MVETNGEWNVTIYTGRAGDRNPWAMQGAVSLGTEIARRYARFNILSWYHGSDRKWGVGFATSRGHA